MDTEGGHHLGERHTHLSLDSHTLHWPIGLIDVIRRPKARLNDSRRLRRSTTVQRNVDLQRVACWHCVAHVEDKHPRLLIPLVQTKEIQL